MWSQLHNKLQMPWIDGYKNEQKERGGGVDHSPTTHPKVDFWQLPALSLLQGADNKDGFGLKFRPFFVAGGGGLESACFT